MSTRDGRNMLDHDTPPDIELERGEFQHHGDHVLAVPLQLPDIPIGKEPPALRQVISTYDSRPISAYDFNLFDTQFPLPVGPAEYVVGITMPLGYIGVLRRVELEFDPGYDMTVDPSLWRLRINGSVQPNFQWRTSQIVAEKGVDTFIVLPPGATLELFAANTQDGSGSGVTLIGRFIGNLLRDISIQPEQLIGSLPHRVYSEQWTD